MYDLSVSPTVARAGRSTSHVEVTNLSRHGLSLLVRGREFFLASEHFPWFQEAQVRRVLDVQLLGRDHLFWPDLDVHLCLESVEHSEKFPLMSPSRPDNALRPAVSRATARARTRHGRRRAARR